MLISRQHKAIVLPFRVEIASLFPHAKAFTYEGQRMLAVSHGTQETIFLRNLGHQAPAPIEWHYDFPSNDGKTAFEAQRRTAALMTTCSRAYILNKMGTGKTRAALWAWHYLYSQGEARKLMIVAPLSTLNVTWGREIMDTLPPWVKFTVIYGTRDQRIRRLDSESHIYIINHDGLNVIASQLTVRRDIDTWVFDEVSAYRNSRAERSKVAQRVSQGRRWVWGMTGSPTPQAPTDAYGLAKLITPMKCPHAFTRFRDETMIKVDQFRYAPRKDAAESVSKLLQPSVCFTLSDVTELPALIERQVDVEQGVRQKQAYKAMCDYAAVGLREGTVTAANGGVVVNKLLQIACGYVYADGQQVATLDNEMRLETVLDIIEGSENKVIVFAPYVHAVKGIHAYLLKHKVEHEVVTGATNKAERDRIFSLFQGTNKLKVLVAHPGCMSHGLNLTAADTIVWFSPTHSLETFEQANARIRRVGQTAKQQVYMLQGSQIERLSYQRLRKKRDVQEGVLELLQDLTGEKP